MKLEATARKNDELGKGASRRLRRAGQIPAIVYGKKGEPVPVILDHNAVITMSEKPEFFETLTLDIDGKSVDVKIQDIQRHIYKPKIDHIDFKRV